MKSSSLLAPRAQRRGSTEKSPRGLALKSALRSSQNVTGEKDVVANRIMRNARANVSHETRVVNVPDFQPVHPLPQRQIIGSSLQPTRRNRNAERRQRRRARQLQVRTTVCPTEIGREVQTGVSSIPYQTREVLAT